MTAGVALTQLERDREEKHTGRVVQLIITITLRVEGCKSVPMGALVRVSQVTTQSFRLKVETFVVLPFYPRETERGGVEITIKGAFRGTWLLNW